MNTKLVVSVVVAGLLVGGSFAQGRPGGGAAGGRQGGGQGGGMRGGMMMGGGGYVGLLMRADVQSELMLSAVQKTKIGELRQGMGRGPGAGGAGGAGGRAGGGAGGAAAGGRGQAMNPAEMQKQASERDKKALAILNDAQKKRAKELLVQRAGNSIILRPDIQAELGMSATQKTKISNLQTKQRDAMQAVFEKMRASGGQPDRDAMREALEKNQKTMDAELGKVLLPAQAAQLKKMAGKPFKFAEGR